MTIHGAREDCIRIRSLTTSSVDKLWDRLVFQFSFMVRGWMLPEDRLSLGRLFLSRVEKDIYLLDW